MGITITSQPLVRDSFIVHSMAPIVAGIEWMPRVISSRLVLK